MKPVYKSKTIIVFVLIAIAFALELATGQDLGTGIDPTVAATAVSTSLLGIALRFVTSEPIGSKPDQPRAPPE